MAPPTVSECNSTIVNKNPNSNSLSVGANYEQNSLRHKTEHNKILAHRKFSPDILMSPFLTSEITRCEDVCLLSVFVECLFVCVCRSSSAVCTVTRVDTVNPLCFDTLCFSEQYVPTQTGRATHSLLYMSTGI